MSDDPDVDRQCRSTETRSDSSASTPKPSMRARTWTVAYRYYAPEDYGIPTLPDWHVRREGGGMALVEDGNGAPFIRAERPMRVRR